MVSYQQAASACTLHGSVQSTCARANAVAALLEAATSINVSQQVSEATQAWKSMKVYAVYL